MRSGRLLIFLSLGGIGAAIIGLVTDQAAFFRAYLVAFSFWTAASLGCLALLLTHNITGGQWGEAIRVLLAAGARILPLMGLLFLPLLAGLPVLYPWAQSDAVAASELLRHRVPYMNPSFFVLRSVFYLLLWTILGWLLSRDFMQRRRLSAWSLILLLFTVTMAAMDWLMSVDTDWHSLIYGVLFMAICILIGFSLVLALSGLLRHHWDKRTGQDLGNLLLAVIVSWGYLAFVQYLVIWTGNLPEEISWYITRAGNIWEWVMLLVFIFGFLLPCILLLISAVKQQPRLLTALAAAVCLAHFGGVLWLIKPGFGAALHWLDLVLPIGMGGLWLLAFMYVRRLNRSV